jgi:hypothetical protein
MPAPLACALAAGLLLALVPAAAAAAPAQAERHSTVDDRLVDFDPEKHCRHRRKRH